MELPGGHTRAAAVDRNFLWTPREKDATLLEAALQCPQGLGELTNEPA